MEAEIYLWNWCYQKDSDYGGQFQKKKLEVLHAHRQLDLSNLRSFDWHQLLGEAICFMRSLGPCKAAQTPSISILKVTLFAFVIQSLTGGQTDKCMHVKAHKNCLNDGS